MDFDNGFTCIPKGLVVHPPMRIRDRMSSLMLLPYKNKINNDIKERKKNGIINGQLQNPEANLSPTPVMVIAPKCLKPEMGTCKNKK